MGCNEKQPILRPFRPSDIDDFLQLQADDRVMQFLAQSPCTTKEEALDRTVRHPWCRAICNVEDRAHGFVSISPGSGEEGRRKAVISYGLSYDHWGKGMATAAVRRAVAEVFEEWPELERVEGWVDAGNEGSLRVLEKAGFQREGALRRFANFKGRVRDVVVFSFLSSDPFVC